MSLGSARDPSPSTICQGPGFEQAFARAPDRRTPLGYPADQPGPKIRKLLRELVRYERW